MDYVFAFLMFSLCVFTIRKMFKERSALWVMIGLIGIFSIGYYVLPVFFKQYAHLSYTKVDDIAGVLLMSILFFAAIITGVLLNDRFLKTKRNFALQLNVLDPFFIKNYKKLFLFALIIWLSYYFTTDLTAYNASDFEDFFYKKTALSGVLSMLSNISLSIMAICIAMSFRNRNSQKLLFVFVYVVVVIMLLVTGQRLFVITPIFILMAAFCVYRDFKTSVKITSIGICVLVLVSPVMEFFRSFDEGTGKMKAIIATKKYESDTPFETGFLSIMSRADLLYGMVRLKDYYDIQNAKFDHVQYLSSVVSAYIPRIIRPDKPFPLSDNGQLSGEISVLTWNLIVGKSTGSLSAFGSITAYREGGWLWVIVNGFLTGLMFAWVYHFLAKGGAIAKLLYISIFVTLSIKNVPLSFFYFLVYIAPTIYIIVISSIVNRFLYHYK